MDKKKSLFTEEHDEGRRFGMNEQFAQSFQRRKERELIDKYKARYGSNYEEVMQDEIDSESNYSNEDEDGEYINERVTDTFIQTLAKLRMKHPDIYKQQELFQDGEEAQPQEKETKLSYAQTRIQQLMQQSEEDEDEPTTKGPVPHNEEQLQLKNAFKMAAASNFPEADSLLRKKNKTPLEVQSEQQVFQKFVSRMQKTEPQNDVDVLKRFWGGESDVLDEKDRFLRKFILTKGWVDRDEVYDKRDDSEEYEEKVDRYEEKYNFRYEEPGGTTLTTYQRNIEGTVREGGNEARRTKRHAKESRIQQQKLVLEEELHALKLAKKEQLIDRINKIYEVGGVRNHSTKAILRDITGEFDDQGFDAAMEKMYDEQFYEDEESDDQEIKGIV